MVIITKIGVVRYRKIRSNLIESHDINFKCNNAKVMKEKIFFMI